MFELAQMTSRLEQWWHRPAVAATHSRAEINDPRADWLPQKWCQRTSRFLDQQFWCFGQDIVHAPRNALLELGFTRHRPQTLRKDGGCYTVSTRAGVSIALWGFGVFYSDRSLGQSFLLLRDDIRPQVVEQMQLPIGVWSPLEIPRHEMIESEAPMIRTMLADLMHWFSQYEKWVSAHRTQGHREATLREWKRVVVQAKSTEVEWQSLSKEVRLMPWKRRDSV